MYFATGNNYKVSVDLNDCYAATAEADWEASCNLVYGKENWFESVVALNINTGAKVWAHRFSSYDAWTVACFFSNAANCPASPGDDYDFGMAPVVGDVTLSGVLTKALFVGQKSGIVFCINRLTGATIWSTQTSPGGTLGGLSWGISVDDTRVYASVANYLNLPWTLKNGTIITGGGWIALKKTTGEVLWTTANPAYYDPSGLPGDALSNGRSTTSWGTGPATAVGDIVFVTSSDSVYSPSLLSGTPVYGSGGYVYTLSKTTGQVLTSFETKGGVYGGFAVDSHCAFVGYGYSFLSDGKGVYGWCIA